MDETGNAKWRSGQNSAKRLSKQRILGTARVTRSLCKQHKLIKYADVAELAASSMTASAGRNREGEMAQRSKIGEANSKQQILGTARVTRTLSAQNELIKYADVAELADALDSGSSES